MASSASDALSGSLPGTSHDTASETNKADRQQDPRSRKRSRTRSRSPARISKASRRSRSPVSSPAQTHETPKESTEDAPPLPDEPVPTSTDPATQPSASDAPPLPDEPVPQTDPSDDGWEPVWDDSAQAFYFYNRFTQATQWDNPRVPAAADGASLAATKPATAGGYNPAIHGDYDPNADYALSEQQDGQDAAASAANAEPDYAATASFNRWTGRFTNTAIHPTHTPDAHTDDAKSRRQLNAFYDVDAAANAHDGRSLKAERQGRKLTKEEVRAFREKKKNRKEEKRRAWLRD